MVDRLNESEKTEKRLTVKKEARERQRKLRIDDFVKQTMQTPQGREYMYWLLEMTQVRRNPFTGNALSTMFQCGELNIGQKLEGHIIEVSPQGYLHMLTEKQEEEMNDRQSPEPDSGPDKDA